MSDKIGIAPTCVPHSAGDISAVAALVPEASGVHLDIDDGIFASPLTWPYASPGILGSFTVPQDSRACEVHLMVKDPREIGILCAKAGIGCVIGHFEAFDEPETIKETLHGWQAAGAHEVGLALLYQTDIERIAPYIDVCDVVHLMTIATIGVQGIPFESSAIERVAAFHARYPQITISVDGGVSAANIESLVHAGARRFGVGSAIARAADPRAAYAQLKSLAERAL